MSNGLIAMETVNITNYIFLFAWDTLSYVFHLFQAKSIVQAEIDCAAELADFYRFNVQFGLVSIFFFFLSIIFKN